MVADGVQEGLQLPEIDEDVVNGQIHPVLVDEVEDGDVGHGHT